MQSPAPPAFISLPPSLPPALPRWLHERQPVLLRSSMKKSPEQQQQQQQQNSSGASVEQQQQQQQQRRQSQSQSQSQHRPPRTWSPWGKMLQRLAFFSAALPPGQDTHSADAVWRPTPRVTNYMSRSEALEHFLPKSPNPNHNVRLRSIASTAHPAERSIAAPRTLPASDKPSPSTSMGAHLGCCRARTSTHEHMSTYSILFWWHSTSALAQIRH